MTQDEIKAMVAQAALTLALVDATGGLDQRQIQPVLPPQRRQGLRVFGKAASAIAQAGEQEVRPDARVHAHAATD